ncbi:MAG: hypothetical protein GX640_18255, partial [Fibrobacter sp.]|nr:hypothetical protein [Fibrobacter sp.]
MNISQVNWSTLSHIKSIVSKKWNSGIFLKEFLEPSDLFPFRIPLRGPGPNDLSSQFDLARSWVQQFLNTDTKQLFEIEWQQVNNRVLGQNQLPVAVIFNSRENLFRYINKESDFKLFTRASQKILNIFPELKEWIVKHPFALIENSSDINRLIRITEWMKITPRPGIYIRQLSLPDIDTKFIEKHKKLLAEWFDIILDSSFVDETATGIRGFERRFGFLEKPVQIRFRILDKNCFINGLSDLTIRADEFCTLNPDIDTVFVTENDINGLAFPMVRRSIILFGRGYGFEYLQNANWLQNKKILYWGDIDTHGFVILSQFRKLFPSVQSFLMDRDTLLAYSQYWVKEEKPSEAIPKNLTNEEYSLYNALR